MADNNMSRDLVLAPGEFAYVLDTTKGLVNVIVGPNKVSMSNTDQPVVWDKMKLRFVRCEVDAAIQRNPIAPEGFYLALYNPASENAHPREGSSVVAVNLNVGHRVNLPGPVHFPLWPGQMVDVIRGHHIRSNQYLLAQVYNDAQATENWAKAVVKPQETASAEPIAPRAFAPGQLMVIKGTEVAFFIPPTGIKVVAENSVYVRDAVTLERLEYCILLDENGKKRFVQGPDVVFPAPTEHFVVKDEARKFNAIELNDNTGIYVKVTADYTDDSGDHKVGEELFITGKEQAIYFQREEHSVIRYGGQTKHYAVAVPAGEGRYVLDRNTGNVGLVRGPQMLLCDPRREVIIRRVLDEKSVKLWFPGNSKALLVNQELDALNKAQAGTSQYEASRAAVTNVANYMSMAEPASATLAPTSRQIAGDQFQRGTSFTPPRTITLDTKYEGAVAIAIWPGYSVLVVNKTGDRHVEHGPAAVLLAYDETLAPLELSTGTPKTDGKLLSTVYLRVQNNTISDLIRVETADLVKVDLRLSYRVNFLPDASEKWFAVENYVRLLCDHMRSLVRNVAKRQTIEKFYGNAIDIVRDAMLGPVVDGHRPGRVFEENGMHVYDVEVLDVAITDAQVADLFEQAQGDALVAALHVAKQERLRDDTRRIEVLKQEMDAARHATLLATHTLTKADVAAQLEVSLGRVRAEAEVEATRLDKAVEEQVQRNALNAEQIARETAMADAKLAAKKREIETEIQRMVAETEQVVGRAGAVTPNLAIALTTFSDQALVEKISTALAPMAAMNGVSAADVLYQLFRGTPFADTMKALGTRSRMPISTTAE